MRVLSLAVRDWRNFEEVHLDCDGDFVVIHGDNGQGKTNLIEAVWMLATLKSFREHNPHRLIRHGAAWSHLSAELSGISGRRRLAWSREGGRRQLRVDGQAPARLLDWFKLVRAILFCPAHGEMIRGQPVIRRRAVDRAAFTANPVHLELIRDFQRVIRQKSVLLKSSSVDRPQLETWNQRLADLGARVVLRRAEIIDQLGPSLARMHRQIAGHDRVSMRMRGIGGDSRDLAEIRERISAELAVQRAEELRRQRVLVGPQRDDLLIELDGQPSRNFASQGQVRSLVLAFKLAELIAARDRGDELIFLLDDLSSELDRGRMGRLIELLGELQSQVWMTTTHPDWLGPLPAERTVSMKVHQGMVIPV